MPKADRFNWQTEDEDAWVEPAAHRRMPQPRRGVWAALLGLMIVAGCFAVLYQLGQWRTLQRELVIKREILAVHTTWRRAVVRGDEELFAALTARDDPRWYAAQRQLLQLGRTLDRQALGLTASPEPGPEPVITLSPDLDTALFVYQQPYSSVSSDAVGVFLQQTAFYRRQGSVWVQQAPPADVWGPTQMITSANVVADFPERDRSWVERIVADLDRDLGEVCGQIGEGSPSKPSPLCDANGRIRIDFLTDASAVAAFLDRARPSLDGLSFSLPSPTLIGVPVDEAGYQVVYAGYTGHILETLRHIAAQPIPLPDQDIAALCFTSPGSRLDLVTYRLDEERWVEEEADRSYRYLWPTPDDEGLLLRVGLPGIDLDRLQVTWRRHDQETALLDVGTALVTASLTTFAHTLDGNGYVVRFVQGSTGVATYEWFPLATCEDGACAPRPLDGFTIWSPDSERTLINDVGELKVGDSHGNALYSLGAGFSPFWLSPTTFGYVELSDPRHGPDMRIAVRTTLADEPAIVADTENLMERVYPDREGRLRIRYVTSHPTDPSLVLVAVSPTGSSSRDYAIVALRLSVEPTGRQSDGGISAKVVLRLPTAPTDNPTTSSPTGSPPFTLSEDGRWLMAVRFTDPTSNSWEVNLVDLTTGEIQVIKTNHPPYPAQFPFFDWSADGQWLVVVDDGYVRLLAPAYGYERVIPHEFGSCRYTGWVNH